MTTSFGRASYDLTSSLRLASSVELKRFEWDDFYVETKGVSRVDDPKGRYYCTPDGNFPSVTAVLGDQPKPELEAWKTAVGEEEAARVSRRATAKGTALHDAMELYLRNKMTHDYVFPLPEVRDAFMALKRVVDEGVTKVCAVEQFLWSKHLRMAGTCDLICYWKDRPAILDYKNLGRVKHAEEIDDYFIQETAYSVMVNELTGLMHRRLVVATTAHGLPIIHESEVDMAWITRLLRLRDDYERKRS